MMGLMGLNTSTQNVGLTWANYTPSTYFTQATPTGVNVEYLVDLANVLQENMWVNMPVGADNSFVTNFAGYVEQHLDSNLNVYVEYGNEVWNSDYHTAWLYVDQYAIANNLSFFQADAVLSANTWNIWRNAFAGQTNRVLRVVANQFVNPALLNQEITELVSLSSPSDPDHGFDVVAGAPYFGPNTSSYNAQTTVQQIERDSLAALIPLKAQLQSFMNMVTTWTTKLNQKIPVIMYESGLGLTASPSAPWWNAFVAAETDSGMYSVMLTYFDDLQAAGVAGFNFTLLVDPTSQYGEWGTMNYIGEPPSLTPKYSALLSFINSQGPSLSLSDAATTIMSGAANIFTVTAYDASGNVETGYTGTVQFSSSDPNAALPASYTFTAADAGQHTFSLVFDTVGSQSISATDTTDGLYGLEWGISVQPAAAVSLAVIGYPTPVVAGVGERMTVYPLDAYGNIATNYTGTVKISSSDPHASLPGNQTFTTGSPGYDSFSLALKTSGVQSVTATDTSTSSVTGTESGIAILPAAAKSFTISGFPSPTDAGVANKFTVTAYDPYGNIATGYLGTVEFTSSDQDASLPVNYTFVSSNAGTQTFNATLNTTGNQSITVTDSMTASIAGSIKLAVGPATTASFSGEDATTQGSWKGVYGSQGYNVIKSGVSYPSYATVTATGNSVSIWAANTTAVQALQDAPPGTGRIAADWYSTSSFTVDVNLTDGKSHNIELYLLDYDSQSRSEQIQLTDATTHAVLSTQNVSSFQGGVYLNYTISGNVLITFTNSGGPSAVLSGLFFDPAPPPVSTGTSLNSSLDSSTYGRSVTFTSSVSDTTGGGVPTGSVEFYDGSTDLGPGSPLSGSGSSATSTFTTSTLTAGIHSISAVYIPTGNLVSSSSSLSQSVNTAALTITANSTSKTYGNTLSFAGTEFTDSGLANSDTISSVTLTSAGAAASAQVAGSPYSIVPSMPVGTGLSNYTIAYVNGSLTVNPMVLTITATGVNEVYDGTTTATVTLSDNRVAGDTFTDTYTSALFPDKNVGTGMNVNVSGISISGPDASDYTYNATATTTANITPMALTVTAVANTKTYDSTTTAVATPTITAGSLQGSDTASFTETYASKNAGTNLVLTPSGTINDGNSGKNYTCTFVTTSTGIINPAPLTITAITNIKDYDGTTSAAAIPTVSGLIGSDSATNLTESYASPNVGTGLTLNVATDTVNDGNGGKNYTVTSVPNNTGVINISIVDGEDTTTQGSWKGVYGSQGYNVINSGVSYPSYATVSATGNYVYTWAANTTAVQALQDAPPGTGRIAACWYSNSSFTVDVNLTDGKSHNIELYLLDYDSKSRGEQIQITNATTHAVLSTQDVSSFQGGVYMNYTISGNVLIKFTKLTGPNAVLSGLFFDQAPPSSPSTSLTSTVEKLDVYPNAVDVADEVASLAETFPRGHGALVDRLNRAALSIATNLAKGNGRVTKPDRRSFFTIARGSAQKIVPLLKIARTRGLVAESAAVALEEHLEGIARVISGLINGLDKRDN